MCSSTLVILCSPDGDGPVTASLERPQRGMYPPDDAEDHPSYDFVSAAWAKRWPAEEMWIARKT